MRNKLSRRRFNQWLAASLAGGVSSIEANIQPSPSIQLPIAAIQMVPELGNVQSNLKQAEHLIQQALKQGARWIVLPEMFTSAVAFHNDMMGAIEPLEGKTLQRLKTLAKQGNAHIGGSFLAQHRSGVFNTFVLVSPDGSVQIHNKDQPTYWENCYYQGGNDDGVLQTSIGPIGAVLCWEFIRSKTARRLLNRVNLVLGGSCWWTLPDDASPDSPRWADNLKMLQQAPVKMAQMLGVPVVHGSHAGEFEGFFSPELADVAYHSSFLGETMIVDSEGHVLNRLSKSEGEGVVFSELEISKPIPPSETIPDSFWMPNEMPEDWKNSWERWFDQGADYYNLVTEPYLETGLINDYEPPYLR